jgi:TorA maturation chaperone TorD
LWLLAHLWKKEAEAPPADRARWTRRRARFANEHLMAWLGDLAANVRENQRAPLYGVALEIAQVVTALDEPPAWRLRARQEAPRI